jgi:menaquinone-specific isochorismate synthase
MAVAGHAAVTRSPSSVGGPVAGRRPAPRTHRPPDPVRRPTLDVVTIASAAAPTPLVVRTTEIEDPGPLLRLLPDVPALSWVRRGEGLVGWGQVTRLDVAGRGPTGASGRFEVASAWWGDLAGSAVVRDEVGLPGTGPVAFGSFAFDERSARGSALIVPEVVVGHREGRWWVTTVGAHGALPTPEGHLVRHTARPCGPASFTDGSMAGGAWRSAVAQALAQITAGRIDKVVLARDITARTERPVDPRWVLGNLADRYPGCWTFGVDGLLGATPELLVRLERGLVHSRVLAGTIRRTGDDEHDLALAGSLVRSSKDLEEHEYAVRSLADALAPHCTSMNVPETPFVLHLPNVMHLATDVAGVLGGEVSSLALAAALHPTAAVGGTPTPEAVEVIRRIEGMDRGRYAGPVGWIDGNLDGEWGIALRCAETDPADDRRLRLFAGCGIVAGSDPAAELAESEAKLVPMRDALTR